MSTGEWRKIYNEVQNLAKYLKDSRPDIEGNPPVYTLSFDTRYRIESEIKKLTKRSSIVLNKLKLFPNQPRWKYNKEDETTWATSEKFKFEHLIEPQVRAMLNT